MAAPTFGVTEANFADRFSGQSFADWSVRVDRWVGMAAAQASIVLRQQGREATDVTAGSDLYSLCAQYIEFCVVADIARAQGRQDPAYAVVAAKERERIEQLMRSHNESLTSEDFDTQKMLGSVRGGGRKHSNWKGQARW